MHMHARKHHLLALAVGAILLPAVALADKPASTGQGNKDNATAQPAAATSTVERSGDAPKADPRSDAGSTRDIGPDDIDTDDEASAAATDAADRAAGASDAGATTDSAARTNPGRGNWWTDADADGDGRISRDEARGNEALDPRFASIDGDGDGFMTRDEYLAFYTSSAARGADNAADHSAVVVRDTWSRLDRNGDGRLSSMEVDADADLRIDFGDMDTNDDGFVGAEEFRLFERSDDD